MQVYVPLPQPTAKPIMNMRFTALLLCVALVGAAVAESDGDHRHAVSIASGAGSGDGDVKHTHVDKPTHDDDGPEMVFAEETSPNEDDEDDTAQVKEEELLVAKIKEDERLVAEIEAEQRKAKIEEEQAIVEKLGKTAFVETSIAKKQTPEQREAIAAKIETDQRNTKIEEEQRTVKIEEEGDFDAALMRAAETAVKTVFAMSFAETSSMQRRRSAAKVVAPEEATPNDKAGRRG